MKSILARLLATTFALCTLLNTGTAQVPSFPPCPGCQTTDVTYVATFDGVVDPNFDGGPHSKPDGTTIMVSITNPASGKCWQIPKIVEG